MNLKKYKISDDSFEDNSNENVNNLESQPIEFETNKNNLVSYSDQVKPMKNNEIGFEKINDKKNSTMVYEESVMNSSVNQVMKQDDIYHQVQIIDEDVENFKRRLDITIKNFRTDTLKDFMSIKRSLLVEQKAMIDSEKQKCDALISAKVDQIEHLKESLAKTKNAYNAESEIKERLANYLFKIKNFKYQNKLKTKAFTNGLKKYHLKRKKNNLVKYF
jgi:hypothetical protein